MGFMRGYNLVSGIVCIVAGVFMIGGAVALPVAALGLGIGGLSLIAAGGFCIWWHQITKGTIMAARPVGFGAGFAQMAAGTAQANAMLSGMVAQNAGAVQMSVNGQPIPAPQGIAARGRVVQVTPVATEPNGNQVVVVNLTVTGTQYAPYDVNVRESLSPVGLSQLKPGADIAVAVNALDAHTVSLNLPVR